MTFFLSYLRQTYSGLTAFAIFVQVFRLYTITTCIKGKRLPTIAQYNLYTFNFFNIF